MSAQVKIVLVRQKKIVNVTKQMEKDIIGWKTKNWSFFLCLENKLRNSESELLRTAVALAVGGLQQQPCR